MSFKPLSHNEVSGVRLNSRDGEVAVYMSGEFGLAGGSEEHDEDWLECFRTECQRRRQQVVTQ